MAEVIEVRNSATDIDNDATSVIGLRHLDEIKAYVDGRLGNVSGELSGEMKDYFDDQMEKARDFITNDTTNRLDDLKNLLEDAIAAGDLNAIRDIELKIDALNSDFTNKLEAIDAINEQVERLNGKYGDLSNSIFSPGEIDELIKTAFIEGTYITDDKIETPNLFTTKLVALIANFGKIQAANIEGGAISGHTIESNNNIPGQYDENGNPIPLWKIENDGSGWLASKNIEWNENGDVRFGDDVSLSWKNVDNEGNPIYNALKDLEDAQNDLRQALNDGIGNVVANWMDDNMLSPMEIKELKNELERMTADYNTMEKYLNEIIPLYESAANSEIDKDVKIKYRDDLKAGRDSLKQSYNSAKSVCENYINAVKDSVGSIKIDPEKYGDLNKINEYYVKRDEVLKTYYDANSFYVTDNRFGSKLTYIGEDGIYSGKIMGDQITGWRLRGLTMESAKTTKLPDYVSWYDYNHNATDEENAFSGKTGGIGPTWQISKDGNGYLAGGQISWSDQNITLGNKVRINWKQVDDVPEGLENLKNEVEYNYNELLDKLGITREELANLRGSQESIKTNLISVNNAIKVLTGALNSVQNGAGGDSDDPNTVLNEDEIKNIVYALTQDPVYASAVWAGVVSAGVVKAEEIIGSKISGITVESYKKKPNSSDPYWQLNKNGDGYLAGGAITWNQNGGVTLGKGVTINWDTTGNNGPIPPEIGEDGEPIDVSSVVNATKLGAYTIGSGIIAGNLIQGRNDIVLEKDTKVYRIVENEDSAYIEEDPIVADGLTDKGPSWQIHGSTGKGYLAAGHIRWDDEGNLTANINTGGSVGNNVMTWDADNIYIKKNLVFEENSTISWSDSTKPETGEGGGVSEDKVKELATEITKDTIQTGELYANNLTVAKLNTGLSVDEDGRPTTYEGKRIEATNNQLLAYDEYNKNTLVISGDSTEVCSSNDGAISRTQFGGPINDMYLSGDIGTISLTGDKNSTISIPARTYNIAITGINRDTSFNGVKCTIKLFINGVERKTYTATVSSNDGSWMDDNTTWVSSDKSTENYTYNCTESGTHTIKWTYEINRGSINADSSKTITLNFLYGKLYASSTTLDIKTIVASNGFRTTISTTEYAEFIKDSNGSTSMKIISGQNGISVNNSNLSLLLNGAWYNLTPVNISGHNVLTLKEA